MTKLKLYYDKECPFCNHFAHFLKLKERYKLEILNARDKKEEIKSLKKQGFDINDGVILVLNEEKILHAEAAIVFLNDVSKSKFFFYDNWFFISIVYPTLKQIRKILLFIKGKKVKI